MNFDVVRAWKDATYRASLSAEEQALLPASPAGEFELSEADLEAIEGAGGSQTILNSTSAIPLLGCLQSVVSPCLTNNGNCFNSEN
jgi:mersacidin/lichenicidin family type 2 lantibiotic